MKVAAALLMFMLAYAWGLPAAGQTAPGSGNAQQESLRRIRTIQLPGAVQGRFDHFGVDLKNKRLFATAENHHGVLVIDIDAGKVIHEISVIKPHAVLYREDLDRIYITDGTDGSLEIFDGSTYEPRGRIALNRDADSMGYDPVDHLLYVVSGGKDAGQKSSSLSVIDTTAEKKLADIEIDGDTVEAIALDVFRPKLYVNNPAKNEIDVVDRWSRKVIAGWPVTMGKTNVAIALDEPHQRLFTACRSGQIVVFDTNTGREMQAIPITTGVDDLAYDAASRRLYAAGNGTVDVIRQMDADRYESLGSKDAGLAAKTARLVPELNRYFVAVPQNGANAAAIAVFEPINLPSHEPFKPSVAKPLSAPLAERLVLSTLSAHPDLRKMGLHAVPPGQSESVIIANGNRSRVGIKSTQGDLQAVKDGKTYCSSKQNGSYYNLKLPLLDASGRHIGILVMEMPFTSASDDADASRKAEAIRGELAEKITDLKSLFGE